MARSSVGSALASPGAGARSDAVLASRKVSAALRNLFGVYEIKLEVYRVGVLGFGVQGVGV
jgi:hypothetical protein